MRQIWCPLWLPNSVRLSGIPSPFCDSVKPQNWTYRATKVSRRGAEAGPSADRLSIGVQTLYGHLNSYCRQMRGREFLATSLLICSNQTGRNSKAGMRAALPPLRRASTNVSTLSSPESLGFSSSRASLLASRVNGAITFSPSHRDRSEKQRQSQADTLPLGCWPS